VFVGVNTDDDLPSIGVFWNARHGCSPSQGQRASWSGGRTGL
jgi:hypothetical protein